MKQNKNTWFYIGRPGLDRTDDLQKILWIRTGSDSILSDQDWTEKFYSPLISECARADGKNFQSSHTLCLSLILLTVKADLNVITFEVSSIYFNWCNL